MRKQLFIGAALAACFGMTTFCANGTPVSIALAPAAGQSIYTVNMGPQNGDLILRGYEYNYTNKDYEPANFTWKSNGANETGLGVACTYSTGPKCDQHEINTLPYQFVNVALPPGMNFSSVEVGVASVDSCGCGGLPETAYISQGSTLLASYTFNGTNRTHVFTFTPSDFLGYNYFNLEAALYIPGINNAADGNILLSSLTFNMTTVPEPAALGMFGLGVLLIGFFMSLRRRRH